MKEIIILKKISKSYKTKKKRVDVFSNLSVTFDKGKFYAIMGPSGSGKSTLFNILGLIDECDNGEYLLFGKDVGQSKDKELSYLRMENIGFIYQDFMLDSYLSAIENVMMPMYLNKDILKNERKNRAMNLLEQLGLKERVNHFPSELSGGEQQRVAIARALVNNPSIILADEPTGNLDESMQSEVFKLLKSLSKEGKCVIVVSHNSEIKKYADEIYLLNNGVLEVKKS